MIFLTLVTASGPTKYERSHKNDSITNPTKPEKINLSKGEPRAIEIINHLILGFSSKNYRWRSQFRESLSLAVSLISATIFFPSFPHFGQSPIWGGNRDYYTICKLRLPLYSCSFHPRSFNFYIFRFKYIYHITSQQAYCVFVVS